jgi:hypothetical protein
MVQVGSWFFMRKRRRMGVSDMGHGRATLRAEPSSALPALRARLQVLR